MNQVKVITFRNSLKERYYGTTGYSMSISENSILKEGIHNAGRLEGQVCMYIYHLQTFCLFQSKIFGLLWRVQLKHVIFEYIHTLEQMYLKLGMLA